MNFRDSIWIRGTQFLALRVTLKFKNRDFQSVYVKSVMRCFLQCKRRQTSAASTRITFYLHKKSHDFRQRFQCLCRRGKFVRKGSSLHLLFVTMFAHICNLRLVDAYVFIHSLLQILHTIHTPYWDILPHHRITNYDVTLPNVLISI